MESRPNISPGGSILDQFLLGVGIHSAADRHAEIILEQARIGANGKIDGNMQKRGVLARGKLISFPSRCFLEVKHISFFETSNPFPDAALFTANHVRMQGYLALPEILRPQAALGAWFLTEGASSGGRHTIVLPGALADNVIASSSQFATRIFQAVLSGELFSTPTGGYVQAQYISLNRGGYVDETSLMAGK